MNGALSLPSPRYLLAKLGTQHPKNKLNPSLYWDLCVGKARPKLVPKQTQLSVASKADKSIAKGTQSKLILVCVEPQVVHTSSG